MTGEFVLYVATGRLLIWIGQTFMKDNRVDGKGIKAFICRLFECDLCLGVWVYTIMAFFWDIRILTDVFPYVPFLSDLVLGCAVSFVTHIFRIGWQEKFYTVIV